MSRGVKSSRSRGLGVGVRADNGQFRNMVAVPALAERFSWLV
ncbi:hypothetical protein ACUY3M_03360 [Corynebacterium suicordis]